MLFSHIPRRRGMFAILSLLMAFAMVTPANSARELPNARVAAQNVDWLSPEQASALALDFPVLVPTWIPAPFGGTPSISASGGDYSLYWMISSDAPTFLQITGKVGGVLPAGSPADLNVQLFVNASVQGYEAIHDVTAIYDTVWWVMGGVLYTVSSQNMTGSDSLSLANSLIPLQAPVISEPEPEPAPEEELPPQQVEASGSLDLPPTVDAGASTSLGVYPSASGTLEASDGLFSASGSNVVGGLSEGSVSWEAPNASVETTVNFSLIDEATGAITASGSIEVIPPAIGGTSGGEANDASPSLVQDESVSESGSSNVEESSVQGNDPANQTDSSSGDQVQRTQLSDGTAGPALPTGGDGTGGASEISVP